MFRGSFLVFLRFFGSWCAGWCGEPYEARAEASEKRRVRKRRAETRQSWQKPGLDWPQTSTQDCWVALQMPWDTPRKGWVHEVTAKWHRVVVPCALVGVGCWGPLPVHCQPTGLSCWRALGRPQNLPLGALSLALASGLFPHAFFLAFFPRLLSLGRRDCFCRGDWSCWKLPHLHLPPTQLRPCINPG